MLKVRRRSGSNIGRIVTLVESESARRTQGAGGGGPPGDLHADTNKERAPIASAPTGPRFTRLSTMEILPSILWLKSLDRLCPGKMRIYGDAVNCEDWLDLLPLLASDRGGLD